MNATPLEFMYRCAKCNQPVAWWRAANATPAVPMSCSTCGTQLHHPHAAALAWLAASTIGIGLPLSGWFGVSPLWVGVSLGACMLLLAFLEVRSYGAAELVVTSSMQKRRARLGIAFLLLGAVAALLIVA